MIWALEHNRNPTLHGRVVFVSFSLFEESEESRKIEHADNYRRLPHAQSYEIAGQGSIEVLGLGLALRLEMNGSYASLLNSKQ